MASRTLPLFPLPLVLFPGVPLPLHIFEPRYRAMLADCLRGDRCFGIVFRAGDAPDLPPTPGEVGCSAHIDSVKTLPDGRSNILVTGTERFTVQRVVSSGQAYYAGEVAAFEDDVEPAEPLARLAAAVSDLFLRVGRAARTLADDSDPLPDLPDDPGRLSFTIASLIDLDASARQRLLASRSASGRLRQIDALLSSTADVMESRAAVHHRARGNGSGPVPSP